MSAMSSAKVEEPTYRLYQYEPRGRLLQEEKEAHL